MEFDLYPKETITTVRIFLFNKGVLLVSLEEGGEILFDNQFLLDLLRLMFLAFKG